MLPPPRTVLTSAPALLSQRPRHDLPWRRPRSPDLPRGHAEDIVLPRGSDRPVRLRRGAAAEALHPRCRRCCFLCCFALPLRLHVLPPAAKRRAPAEDAHSPRLSRASSSRFPRRLTHELIQAYQLPKHMRVCTLGQQWQPATADELNRFHTDQYVDFLQQLTSNAVNVAHEAPNRPQPVGHVHGVGVELLDGLRRRIDGKPRRASRWVWAAWPSTCRAGRRTHGVTARAASPTSTTSSGKSRCSASCARPAARAASSSSTSTAGTRPAWRRRSPRRTAC